MRTLGLLVVGRFFSPELQKLARSLVQLSLLQVWLWRDNEPRNGVCRVMYGVLCFILSCMDNVVSALEAELCVLHKGVVCLLRYLRRAARL